MEQAVSNSPQILRRANRLAILARLRQGGPMSGTDLIDATGLTRATVHGVCNDLIELGWVLEIAPGLPVEPGPAPKGRPARIYRFNASAGVVLGIDMGFHRVTVLVTDLLGKSLAQHVEVFDEADTSAASRIDVVDRCALKALSRAAISPISVLAVGVGVAAPIDSAGETIAGNAFWTIMNVDLGQAFANRHSWPVVYDNDANLAALAERWRGHCAGSRDFAVLLAGERLGSGLVVGGALLHGNRGGAGEMAFLDFTEGVGSTFGIAPLTREWGADEVEHSLRTQGSMPGMIARLSDSNPERVTAEMVFSAAASGDPAASRILDRISDRLARIIGTLASLTNPEIVVIAGAIALASRTLLPRIEKRLPLYTPIPPRVYASELGSEIVSIGAIRAVLDYTELHALEIRPPRHDG